MDMSDLSVRRLKRYGLSRGAYDGVRKRRFVAFEFKGPNVMRSEFDTKRERDEFLRRRLDVLASARPLA